MTIKSHANEKRKSQDATAYEVNFDHMPYILEHRDLNLKGSSKLAGEIFLIDGDIERFKKFIEIIMDTDTSSLKVGVLFRIEGHTTPFCIEKKVDDDSDDEQIIVYHIDSVVMDIDAGPAIKDLIRKISPYADTIYSLGFNDPTGLILRDYKRQSDQRSCATFSLFDLGIMLEDDDFEVLALEYADRKNPSGNIYTLTKLPPKMMSTIQSINGTQDAGEIIRNGLKHIVMSRPAESNIMFEINQEITSLTQIYKEIREEDIQNPIIDILNKTYLDMYNESMTRNADKKITTYNCPNLNNKHNRKIIADKIHDLATARMAREDSIEDDIEKKLQEDSVNNSAMQGSLALAGNIISSMSDNIGTKGTVLIIGLTALTVLTVLQMHKKKAEGRDKKDGGHATILLNSRAAEAAAIDISK